MDALSIMKEWLKKHKYDGFADPDMQCSGCGKDTLMQNCRYLTSGCRPAKKVTCKCGDAFYTTETFEDEKYCPVCRRKNDGTDISRALSGDF